MSSKDPQFLYLVIILPSLLGISLIGEGIYKCFNQKWRGLISIFVGLLFIALVVFAYFFFSSYTAHGSV